MTVPLAGFPDLPHPCRFKQNTQGVSFTPDSQYVLVQNYVEQELAAYTVSGKGPAGGLRGAEAAGDDEEAGVGDHAERGPHAESLDAPGAMDRFEDLLKL